MPPFRVDQLPMSDNVMGIWTSLVRLAGSNAVAGVVATDAPGIHTHPVSLTMKPILAAKGTFTDGMREYMLTYYENVGLNHSIAELLVLIRISYNLLYSQGFFLVVPTNRGH